MGSSQWPEMFHIYQPLPRHDPYFFPHTPWNKSLLIPLCFINVHCRLNLTVRDLRHLFHRNITAAYLRDVLPHFSLKSFTKVQSPRNWFPAGVFLCLTWHHVLLRYEAEIWWHSSFLVHKFEHKSTKTWFLSPRNLDHVICLVKLYLSWKKTLLILPAAQLMCKELCLAGEKLQNITGSHGSNLDPSCSSWCLR